MRSKRVSNLVFVVSILALPALGPSLTTAQTRYTCSLQLASTNRNVNVVAVANLDSTFSCTENGRSFQGIGGMFTFTYTSECGKDVVNCSCSPVKHPDVMAKVQGSVEVPQALCANSTMAPFSARCSLAVNQQHRNANLTCEHNKPAHFFCTLNDGEQVPCATGFMLPDLPPGNYCLQIKAQVEGASEMVQVGRIYFSIRRTTSVPLHLRTSVVVDHERMKATLLLLGRTPVLCTCRLNGGAAAPCRNGTMFTGLAVGDHQLTLNCCSVMARRSCATQQVDIEVKSAMIIQFSGKVTVRGSDVVVEFNSSRSNATYRCRLLKEGVVVVDWELCTSPHKFSGVKPGRYVVQVECTFADMEIQVLEIDPFTVTEPPLLVTELAGVVSEDKLNVVFMFEASQPGAVFLCMLDDGPFHHCLSPYKVPLENLTCGVHSMKVMARLNSGVASEPAEIKAQKQCDVNTTSDPQSCNVDVHLAISEDDRSVTLIYNSPRPNVTLFCGVNGIRARLCLNNSVVAMSLSPGMHVFHGRVACVTSPKEEDYFDLKNTTFKVLPPDACVGKQITGLSVESLQEQNQVILNASFASADGLTVMCSFNGTLQPCTSPYLVDVTYLCTGRYPLVLVGICNGREVTRMESTIRLTRVPDPCMATPTPTPTITTVSVTTPTTTTPTPTPELCRITDLRLRRSRNHKLLFVTFNKSSSCERCNCKVKGQRNKPCTSGRTNFKNAARLNSVTVKCFGGKDKAAAVKGTV